MNLGFRTKWPDGSKTYFPEKIMKSLGYHTIGHQFDLNISKNCKPKIHTIREDKKNRWKKGNDIHFIINNRKKNRLQFMPIIHVISVQTIKIEWIQEEIEIRSMQIEVDNHQLNFVEIKELAINDGFDSLEEFMKWFNKDFRGKIIHWTNFKY